MTSATCRVADYIVSFLADRGARHVFVLPGGGAMHLNDGLACEPRLTAIPCHHEQTCGIAAEAWGRVDGSFGVAMVTTGPGATNIITPVAGAWIESVPMFVISGQVKRADLLKGRPLRQGGVQEVDIIPMLQKITKYAVTVEDPDSIRYHLERAYHAMLTDRSGPVWLDIPLDVQAARIDINSLTGYEPPPATASQATDQTMLDKLGEMLSRAERPLLLAGQGVRLAGAAETFLNLAETLQVPVVTTWNALDIIPYDHPLCVGRPGVVALRAPNFAVQNCDLLIAIGSRLDNVITAYNPTGFARTARKVVVDIDLNEIEKLPMEIDLKIVADAADFIAALQEKTGSLQLDRRTSWLERCKDWKHRYSIKREVTFPVQGLISHYQFMDALSEALPADTLLSTGSAGLAVEVFYSVFRNKPGQRVFLTSGFGSMGYGLPSAIGSCLANSCEPMVAVESDGSLQLNLQELATVKAQNLPICLMVLNNGGYCSIRNTQRNYFNERYLGTGPEAGLWLPDTEKLALAYDMPFMRIANADRLEADLTAALALPRPCIVDIGLLHNETLSPKAAAIPQADGSMISMPLEDMSPLLPLETLKAEMLVPLTDASLRCSR